MTEELLLTGYTAAGGTLSGESLTRLSREMWRLLLLETRGRVAEADLTTPEGALIQQCYNDLLTAGAETEGGMLVSESLGQWSRSYREEKSRNGLLREILRSYLGETGLLYRGWPA